MKHVLPSLLAAFVLLSVSHAQIPAAAKPATDLPSKPPTPAATPTIQARSNLVILDVVVTDKNHAPIHNLKATDFQVREGSAAQAIKTFEEHSPANAVAAEPLPAMPPGTFTNFTPTPANGPLNILLLDKLNTPLKDQPYLQQQLVKFVREMKPGTRIAIFGLNTHLVYLQGFTSNPKLLLTALQSPRNSAQQSALLDNGAAITSDALSDQMDELGASAEVVANLKQFEAEEQSQLTQLRVRYTLEAMQTLARYLAALPGRKNLIWFSGSFPLSILPDSSGDLKDPFAVVADMQDQFREATGLLTRAQVAVYPVDARGLQSSPAMDASQSGEKYARNPTRFGKDESTFLTKTADEHSTMRQMAHDTGGEAYVNTNGLADAVSKAIDLGSSYYTITYTPTDPTFDGNFRRIQVNLEHPGAELSYRRGYYADDPTKQPGRKQLTTSPLAPASPAQIAMRTAMLRGAPDPTQILFKAYVVPAGTPTDDAVATDNAVSPTAKGPFRRYSVNYAVSPRDFSFKVPTPGHYEGDFEFVVFVYDANGSLLNRMAQGIHANLDLAAIKSMLNTGLQFHQIVSVPASGSFFLRVAVHDVNSDHVGALEVPVDAVKNLAIVEPPAPKRAPPSLNNLPK